LSLSLLSDPDIRAADIARDGLELIREEVAEDFRAAREARKDRQERALTDYALYRRKVREVAQEIEDALHPDRRGPFGWSKIQVPLVFWIVETLIPRLGVNPPTITVNARTPEAVPYTQAKQLRLRHHLHRCGWELPYQMVAKSKLILGDGIGKVPWDQKLRGPRLVDVDWFDFFCSQEATRFEAADVLFHRTAYTRRQLRVLAKAGGEDGPLYINLEDLEGHGGDRGGWDDSWSARLDFAEQGTRSTITHPRHELIPIVEAWYATGEYVVCGGADCQVVIRAEMSPYKDSRGEPVRPFAFFRNTLDLAGPYSIGEAETLEDHQVELSTIRNQWIDQTTANINAPVAFTDDIDGTLVDEAFSQPNGRLAVPSGQPITSYVMRFPPGQTTADVPAITENIRFEAQITSGINDNAAGMAAEQDQTATEVSILAQEANKRVQLKLRMDEQGMAQVAHLFDCHDRQFGGPMSVKVDKAFQSQPGQKSILPVPAGGIGAAADPMAMMSGRMAAPPTNGAGAGFGSGFAMVGAEVNAEGLDYDIEIDAGSSARPDQLEEAQKHMALIGALSHPAMAPLVDWAEMTRRTIQVHGLSEERLMVPPPPPGMPAMPGPPGGPMPSGPQGVPGPVPVAPGG
jgi:hypothetical protein